MLKPINVQLKFIKEKKNCHIKPFQLKKTEKKNIKKLKKDKTLRRNT